jgi:hypothetical protein
MAQKQALRIAARGLAFLFLFSSSCSVNIYSEIYYQPKGFMAAREILLALNKGKTRLHSECARVWS